MVSINTIGVIGCGKMGTDIFYYLSDFDFKLILICKTDEKKQETEKKYLKKIKRAIDRKLIGQQKFDMLCQNIITSELNKLARCDLIIETISEDIDKKYSLFKKIVSIIEDKTIITTNSSSLTPSSLIENSDIKKRFCGLHFFYPVKLKNIVEFIKPALFSEQNTTIITNFLSAIGKNFLTLTEENNSILNKILLEFQAITYNICIQNNISYYAMDQLIRHKIMPSGVFELFDSIGLDIVYNSIQKYTKNFEDKALYIPLLSELEERICKNQLGKKSGEGFYDYSVVLPVIDTLPNEEYISKILLYTYINAVFRRIEKSNCNLNDLDNALREYTDTEKGPIELSLEIGRSNIYNFLNDIYNNTTLDIFPPSKILIQSLR